MTVYRLRSYKHDEKGETFCISLFPTNAKIEEPVEICELDDKERDLLLENIVYSLQTLYMRKDNQK